MRKSRTIAMYAMILALTMLAGFIPFVFLIPLLFTAVSHDFKTTLFAAVSFGLVSYAYSFMGSTFVALAFIKVPIIPIVPRLLVGVIAYFSHFGFTKLIKSNAKLKMYLPKLVSAVLGSAANTVFVILFMYIFIPNGIDGVSVSAFAVAIIPVSIIEMVVNAIVVPPLAISVVRALKYRRENNGKNNDKGKITK